MRITLFHFLFFATIFGVGFALDRENLENIADGAGILIAALFIGGGLAGLFRKRRQR